MFRLVAGDYKYVRWVPCVQILFELQGCVLVMLILIGFFYSPFCDWSFLFDMFISVFLCYTESLTHFIKILGGSMFQCKGCRNGFWLISWQTLVQWVASWHINVHFDHMYSLVGWHIGHLTAFCAEKFLTSLVLILFHNSKVHSVLLWLKKSALKEITEEKLWHSGSSM